jgi:hypothetical protein
VAEGEVHLVNVRVGQVWEDQVGRVFVVISSRTKTMVFPDEHLEGPQRCYIHSMLRLVCGNLSGTLSELFEFPDIPWEKIYTRLA